ncbi:MAG: cation-transporting P-type ATPase [Thermoleophilia bacterium]
MQHSIGKNWHHLPAEEVIELLETDPEAGLDVFDVKHRRDHYGPNVLTARGGPGALKRLLLQFHQPLIYILLAAGVITLFLREWVDSGVIFGVVLVNATVGYLQEAKAVQAIEALARTMTTEATVLRGGDQARVPAAELVPGDVVLLQAGDKVPADLRLFRGRDLHIDESALTGESLPVGKQPEAVAHDVTLAERSNMAYASSLVTFGQGAGAVVGIGDDTEVGRISELIAEADELATPLTKKIAAFSTLLLIVILALGAVTFVVGLLRGESVVDMFKAAVALAVGAIPEGLPAAVTITLAIGVSRMARRRAIIRKLPAVETLGSTTVICTDKTGTLTENQMTVQRILAGGRAYAVSGGGYGPDGLVTDLAEPNAAAAGHLPPALRTVLAAGVLCNDSQLLEEDERWVVQGDPTEGALLVAAGKAGLERGRLEAEAPRLDSIPFESLHQYMATLNAGRGGAAPCVYVKGGVEVVLARCGDALGSDGRRAPLDRDAVHADVDRLAAEGLRVLAFAAGERPPGTTELEHGDLAGLTFLGLQAMIDPPRPEAIAAVKACQTAGIRVKMITGDHGVTAAAIARQIGLVPAGGQLPEVLTGSELERLSDAQLIESAQDVAVFARVTPEQKLRLVEALQSRGHVVAMTGDGVNDAPALKQSDIGTAMGISGTDVAKEAADMVLTDDNFASIEAAVEEGRGVFDNLTKFIAWTLPTNLGEGLVILAAVFLGTTLPILPVQILWINMTTAVLLGLMLAFEPKEEGIMQRQPRSPKTPILTGELIQRIVLVGALLLAGAFGLFEWADSRGYDPQVSRTIAVNVFVVVELFYLFNCRSLTRSYFRLPQLSNRWVLGGVALMILLQLLYTYAPFMNVAFHSAPLDAWLWLPIAGIGLAAFFLVEIDKALRQGVRRRREARRASEPA